MAYGELSLFIGTSSLSQHFTLFTNLHNRDEDKFWPQVTFQEFSSIYFYDIYPFYFYFFKRNEINGC